MTGMDRSLTTAEHTSLRRETRIPTPYEALLRVTAICVCKHHMLVVLTVNYLPVTNILKQINQNRVY